MQRNIHRHCARHFIHRDRHETTETILDHLEGSASCEESHPAFGQDKETIKQLLDILALVQSVHYNQWLMTEQLCCLGHKRSEMLDVLEDRCVTVLLSNQVVHQFSRVDVFITDVTDELRKERAHHFGSTRGTIVSKIAIEECQCSPSVSLVFERIDYERPVIRVSIDT